MLRTLRDQLENSIGDVLAEMDCSVEGSLVELQDAAEEERGLLATPVAHRLAGQLGRSPQAIAEEIVDRQRLPDEIDDVEIVNGFVNYHVDEPAVFRGIVEAVVETGDRFGAREDGRRIVADVSAPNVAKPLHVGHLRNGVLSTALANVFEHRGHEVITDDHIGDWGLQFGNLMYAFEEMGGSEKKLESEPIEHLLDLYQAFNRRESELEAAGKDEEVDALRDAGREWLVRLQDGEERAVELFERFHEVSLARFDETYNLLELSFDHRYGESFYVREGWCDRVIERALESGVAREGPNGEIVVELPSDDPEKDVDEFVLLTADGTTVYGTRDLATIEFREAEFDPDENLYVVANEQDEYFQQLFEVARRMGYDADFYHVSYGLVNLPDGTMSTRAGRIVTARETYDATFERALEIVDETRPELDSAEREAIAHDVALGTMKFEMLKVSRRKDITFDVEEATSFEGDTGPYLQYATVRAKKIVEKAGEEDVPPVPEEPTINDLDFQLAALLGRFPLVLAECEEEYDATPLATYALDLAGLFNTFYAHNPVLDAEANRDTRLALTAATHRVLTLSLDLLGINTLDRM